MAERLLKVDDLSVHFSTVDGTVRAVDGVSFELERGQVLGIVGESGSGKSVTAMTLMGLTRDVNSRFGGEVRYKGRNLLELSEAEMQDYRGNEIGMIFQDPMTSLNPVYRIGEQIADAILVMYAGRVVERAEKRPLFYDPQHPYTWGLLGSIPRLDRPRPERLHSIKGSPPSLINAPAGCKFRPRCPHAFEKCTAEPALENRVETPGHLDRCWLDVEYKRAHRDATINSTSEAA